jgi:hypothetical protein
MRDLILLIFHLLTTLADLVKPDRTRAVIAGNLLLKQQLITHRRARHRAPNLTTQDRTLLGFLSLFLNPRRLARSAIIIKPSTLLGFYKALRKRKYRLLYSPGGGKRPGPKGPSKEVINAIVEMKQRNTRYGCPRITQQLNLTFRLHLDKDTVRRVLAGHYKPDLTSLVMVVSC